MARAGVWKTLRQLREGHWGGGTRVKRLRGVTRPVYEARTDSGDRLLFTLARAPVENDPGRMAAHLQVWDWVGHDDVERTARRNRFPEAEFLELEAVEQFDIDEPPPHPEATFAEIVASPADTETVEPLLQFLFPPEGLEVRSEEEPGIRWYRLEPDALAGEEEFQHLLDKGGEELELKLSREQYDILRSPGPVLLAGSAGSGKTTVTIHRLAAAPSTALYLSYSPALVVHSRKLYRDLATARGAEARPANFYTFGELYRTFVNEPDTPEMTEALFNEWFRKSGKSLDPALVWEELRSILKGACLDLDKPMLDEAAYYDLGKKRAPLFVDLRPEIYRLAQRYQQWLADEGRSDRIDLCRRAFAELRKGRGRTWDVVVCDEVQDLTELEVAFVLALSRRPDLSGVLLTGDTQQIIQPSGFRWAEVRRLAARGKSRPEVQRLRRNLRAVRPLVELANALLLLRREVFGRTEEDEPEDAALDGPVPIEVPAGEEAVLAAIEGFGPRCAVLTTEEEAGRLRARLGTSRVFHVRDAKGLEFDIVVLWKLLGPDQDLVERLLRGADGLDREPRFQRLLQHLYVAVTRARRHLVLYEGSEPHPFWSDARFRGRLERETAGNLARLFRPTASPGEWEREGDWFLERGHFRQAAECFRRAGRSEREAEALALAGEEREDWAGALARWTGLRRADRQAPLLARLGRLAEAAALYREAGLEAEARLCDIRLLEARKSWKEAAAAWESLGRHADAARCWERAGMRRNASVAAARAAEEAGEPGKAGELWMEAGDFEAAARCFRAAGEPVKTALALARLHEEAGRWSRAAAAWRLGGDPRNAARCRAEHLEQADRPGPAAVYRERLGESERALGLYVLAGRWLDAARLEPARPEEHRQVLPKIRELIESGGHDEAERLLAIRKEAVRLPNIPGAILLGAERLAWQELLELERLEHRNSALLAEAGRAWSRAARQWALAWEPQRAEQACRKGGRTAAWQPAPSPVIHKEEPEGHPDPGILRRLLAEVALAAETRVLVQHLVHQGMHGCPDCLSEIGQASQPPTPPLDDYDAAFDRVHDKIARGEIQGLRRATPPLKGLHAEVFEHTYVQMLLAMHGTRRATDLSLCELLLRKSRELWARDPGRARRAAELAAETAELVQDGLYGSPVVQDIHAWSWAQPVHERHDKGEDRLVVNITDKIRQLMAWAPDPPLRAGLLALQAFLAGSRGRIDEAVRVFNRAASIHRRMGDRHLFGRVLLQKGILLGSTREGGEGRRHAMALRLIRRSLDLVDPAREPRLVVNAAHHLIWFLSQMGRTAEAEACLHAARRLYERAGDRRHLGRLYWLEGKIATRPREAEAALVAARDALNREGLGHEAALATLDLGALYVRERREVDVRRQPELVFALASSGSMLKDTTFLVETTGDLAREEPPAPLLDELSSWMERMHKENNPPALVPNP
ncbi:MAG: ATP-dependent helicase UvrD/PcrA [Acidobacteriota bacterium]|nr:ATP-dependent helicase UvrD/PcrA [Acidobacteriota bacterium]